MFLIVGVDIFSVKGGSDIMVSLFIVYKVVTGFNLIDSESFIFSLGEGLFNSSTFTLVIYSLCIETSSDKIQISFVL